MSYSKTNFNIAPQPVSPYPGQIIISKFGYYKSSSNPRPETTRNKKRFNSFVLKKMSREDVKRLMELRNTLEKNQKTIFNQGNISFLILIYLNRSRRFT